MDTKYQAQLNARGNHKSISGWYNTGKAVTTLGEAISHLAIKINDCPGMDFQIIRTETETITTTTIVAEVSA